MKASDHFSYPERGWTLRFSVFPLIALCFIFLVLPSLNAPFYFDDRVSIVHNPVVRESGNLLRAFSDPGLYSAEASVPMQRGMVTFSYALNRMLCGMHSRCFRIVNIAIHLFCGFLVFLLFRLLFPVFPFVGGALAMSLFLSLPGSLQPAIYINSRAESLSVLFMLVALVLYIKAFQKKKAGRIILYVGLALLAFVLSSYCKESFVLVLPVLFALGLLFPLDRRVPHLLVFSLFLWFFIFRTPYLVELSILPGSRVFLSAIMIAAYLLMVFLIHKTRFLERQGEYSFPLLLFAGLVVCVVIVIFYPAAFSQHRGLVENALNQVGLFPEYMIKTILPYKMSLVHEPESPRSLIKLVVGGASLVIYLCILVVTSLRSRKVFFLLFSIFCSFAAYFFVSLLLVFNENRLYFPACFSSILLSFAFLKASEKIPYRLKRFCIAGIVVIFIFHFTLIQLYLRRVGDRGLFLSHALRLYPGSIVLNLEKITFMYNSLNRPDEAYLELMAFDERWGRKRYARENKFQFHFSRYLAAIIVPVALAAGDHEKARENIHYLEKFHPWCRYNSGYRAQFLIASGDYKGAEKVLRKMIASGITGHGVYMTYVDMLVKLARYHEALEALEVLEAKNYRTSDVINQEGVALFRLENREMVIKRLRQAESAYEEKGDPENAMIVSRLLQKIGSGGRTR